MTSHADVTSPTDLKHQSVGELSADDAVAVHREPSQKVSLLPRLALLRRQQSTALLQRRPVTQLCLNGAAHLGHTRLSPRAYEWTINTGV